MTIKNNLKKYSEYNEKFITNTIGAENTLFMTAINTAIITSLVYAMQYHGLFKSPGKLGAKEFAVIIGISGAIMMHIIGQLISKKTQVTVERSNSNNTKLNVKVETNTATRLVFSNLISMFFAMSVAAASILIAPIVAIRNKVKSHETPFQTIQPSTKESHLTSTQTTTKSDTEKQTSTNNIEDQALKSEENRDQEKKPSTSDTRDQSNASNGQQVTEQQNKEEPNPKVVETETVLTFKEKREIFNKT